MVRMVREGHVLGKWGGRAVGELVGPGGGGGTLQLGLDGRQHIVVEQRHGVAPERIIYWVERVGFYLWSNPFGRGGL